MTTPQILEPQCEWTRDDVADTTQWTELFTPEEIAELDEAIAFARRTSENWVQIGKAEFPLGKLGERLERVKRELIDGRGFVLLRGLPRERYDNDTMCLAYWGIGAHLGMPWPQNKYGHVLGDVTDQGKTVDDPTARGNELGQIGLDFHCDGSDLVGLMCLQNAASGGLSAVCNSVSLHNALIREQPELAAELYQPQPHDYRGEQAAGKRAWYRTPVFNECGGRLFVRLIGAYIFASQRHEDAPRLTPTARAALTWMRNKAEGGEYSVLMDFQPGDMQFINNYHVLHGRTPYVDDRASGRVRHLKRLWLETDLLAERPKQFTNHGRNHWAKQLVISRLDADQKAS